MQIPSLTTAQALLDEAERRNPGPWVAHTVYVAKAAKAIAQHHPQLDPDAAYILGLLHDIGRREGVSQNRHIIDGYTFLQAKGFDDAARICITHSFPFQDMAACVGKWDCTTAERELVRTYLAKISYTPYDELIQLCDALALPTGFCLLEKRFVDVAIRYGTDDYTVQRWQAWLGLQAKFDYKIGRSIYAVLSGVVENTFGLGNA